MTDETPASGRPDAPSDVGWTALVGAAARADERAQPDALFDDPWAPLFLDAASAEQERRVPRFGPGSRPNEMWGLVHGIFVGRTPFIDAEILAARESGVDQFVLLGAGLDARAERLDLAAGSSVFEVDGTDVLAFKQAVLARHGITNARRIPVEADLAREWVPSLTAAGFDPGRPTCWVLEGLLLYLDDAGGRALLDRVRRAGAPGSRVVLDHLSHSLSAGDFTLDDPQDRRVVAEGENLMASGLGPDPAAWCAARDLRLTRLSDVATELRARGRSVPVLLDAATPSHITAWLVAGST